MKVQITRNYYSDVQTRGILTVRDGDEEIFSCKTLELPWKDNKNRESCIPPGPQGEQKTYTLRHRGAAESGKFNYPHFIVKGVEGRSYILIHRGNYYFQVLGCIMPGESFVDINGDGHPDVTRSAETLRKLRETVPSGTEMVVESAAGPGSEDASGLEGAPAAEAAPIPTAEPEAADLPDLSALSEIDRTHNKK